MRRKEQCRSCHAPVFWARTAFNHKAIPVDWDPVDDGNVMIEENTTEPITALVLPPGDERISTETTHTTHLQTCPDNDVRRRKHHG